LKLILLAAGQGKRLAPLTNDVPKCMVSYQGKRIVDYLLDTIGQCNINKTIIVSGYKHTVLENYISNKDIIFYQNDRFESTNMVHSLFCAIEEFDDDIIVSYSDIIYKASVLKKLIAHEADISLVVDNEWFDLWKQRMEDPLSDAETLKYNDNDTIKELGKKATSISEICGQYIGLFKLSKSVLSQVKKIYSDLQKELQQEVIDNMYMTDLLQHIIDQSIPISPVRINGGWLEIDTVSDLQVNMIEKNI